MAVSAYNDDEYDPAKLVDVGLGALAPILPKIVRLFSGDQEVGGELSSAQQEVLSKFIGKQSKAAHSYNGVVRSVTYGYGLKKAVKSFFGYEQTEFKDALQGKAHMGLITGEQVLHYGADDAYWCVRLFHKLHEFMLATNPALVKVFFEQENPMTYIWSECTRRGWPVNHQAIADREHVERSAYVECLKELGVKLKKLSFSAEPTPRMCAKQARWYIGASGGKYQVYRNKINFLLNEIAGCEDEFSVAMLTSGPVTRKWAAVKKVELVKKQWDMRGNFSHYMVVRTLLHDLCDLPFHYIQGEIKTDAEAQGALLEKADKLNDPEAWEKEAVIAGLTDEDEITTWCDDKAANFDPEPVKAILGILSRISTIETRIKLYINPYLMLTDPETDRMYPTISGLLNTRRLAAKNPNPMQLSKNGESSYVRGFFLPDKPDHVQIAIDWSQVELVLIGEASKDPTFFEAYGQVPYQDLHVGAAATAIQVKHPEFTVQNLLEMRGLNDKDFEEFAKAFPLALQNPVKNTLMGASEAFKFWRNAAGKISNFGYWYSGSLMTLQGKLNWTLEEMWEGTENYRNRFPVAEEWRRSTIREAQSKGVVPIFDGHRRTRFEATRNWASIMTHNFNKFGDEGISLFGQIAIKRIQKRAGNQSVNAQIQGGCATLAKRSIKTLWNQIQTEGWDASFTMPIHDELIFSVHKDQAVAFSQRVKEVMCNHLDLVNWLKLDGTISMGITLEPYHPVKAPFGQIELDEAPVLEGYIGEEFEGKALSLEQRQLVVDYLFNKSPAKVEVAA